MKFSFVILHYLTMEDTEECIESILSTVGNQGIEIVVVDNGSPNDSGTKLQEKYLGQDQVHFLLLPKNLGFAKGNNKGYEFAKDELKTDFILLLNNDTIVKQQDLLTKIVELYEETHFHILGPDILSTQDGLHQNPQRIKVIEESELKRLMGRFRAKSVLNLLGIETRLVNLYQKIKGDKASQDDHIEPNWQVAQEGVQLHGSALVFSPLYVQDYNGLYSNTFMYMEEDILAYIALEERLNVLYSPAVQILHKEDSSTNAVFKKNSKKRLFYYRNSLNSAKELQKIHNNRNVYLQDIKSNHL